MGLRKPRWVTSSQVICSRANLMSLLASSSLIDMSTLNLIYTNQFYRLKYLITLDRASKILINSSDLAILCSPFKQASFPCRYTVLLYDDIIKIIQYTMSKKQHSNNQRDVLVDSFMLQQPAYDMTPPSPLPYPKLYYYSLDPVRHFQHKFSPNFFASAKPLLIGADLGLPVDELIFKTKQQGTQQGVLDEEDEALVNQTLMKTKR